MKTSLISAPRGVERIITGQRTTDGGGVKLTRLLTKDLQQRLDPFLMLDNFSSNDHQDYGAGFPSHPHRGFETITYMIFGRMRHQDSAGHQSLVQSGGVQWMTVGRGLIHSEMPEQESGRMEGFQLWLNLPARDKLCPPWYRDFTSAEIPEFTTDKQVKVRVVSGTSQGIDGAMLRPVDAFPTDPLYLDLQFLVGAASFNQPLPAHYNAFLYVCRGNIRVLGVDGQATVVPSQRMAILNNEGDGVRLQADASDAIPARALLIAGQPLGEPIAQHGPFVMNTRAELMQAVEDFQRGRLA